MHRETINFCIPASRAQSIPFQYQIETEYSVPVVVELTIFFVTNNLFVADTQVKMVINVTVKSPATEYP